MVRKGTILRYSSAFKQKVVREIERGEKSIYQAQKIYDINGSITIQRWIKKFGKNYLLSKVVRIEMKDEKDKIKQLEKKVRELETALSNEHLKSISLEALVTVAEKHYKTDFKKNFGPKQ